MGWLAPQINIFYNFGERIVRSIVFNIADWLDEKPRHRAPGRLNRIEKSFRISKHDLQARPIFHHKRESIEAHLSIVFAALAVSHWSEHQTGWSFKKFVRTARRYRTVQITAGRQTLVAADPLPDDLRDALAKINALERAH